jgi:phosphoribosylamine-glycine ligase
MQYVTKDPLIDKLLKPVTEELARIGYVGYVDAAAIISEVGKPNFLEWTMRFGWPCSQIQSVLHLGDPVEWMADLIDGFDSLRVSKEHATGVVVTIPDFPYNKKPREETMGYPVYCDPDNEHIHPADVMAGINPTMVGDRVQDLPGWQTAGPYVLVATGVGPTVSASSRRAYKTIEGIEIPNSPGYRTDIGKRLKEELPKLHEMGYCKGIEY